MLLPLSSETSQKLSIQRPPLPSWKTPPVLASIESYSQVSPYSQTPSVWGGSLGYFSRYDLLSPELLKSCFVPTTATCTFPSIPYLQSSRIYRHYIPDITVYSLRGSSNSTLSCTRALPHSACPLHAPES